jgi:hypothetical protein
MIELRLKMHGRESAEYEKPALEELHVPIPLAQNHSDYGWALPDPDPRTTAPVFAFNPFDSERRFRDSLEP